MFFFPPPPLYSFFILFVVEMDPRALVSQASCSAVCWKQTWADGPGTPVSSSHPGPDEIWLARSRVKSLSPGSRRQPIALHKHTEPSASDVGSHLIGGLPGQQKKTQKNKTKPQQKSVGHESLKFNRRFLFVLVVFLTVWLGNGVQYIRGFLKLYEVIWTLHFLLTTHTCSYTKSLHSARR